MQKIDRIIRTKLHPPYIRPGLVPRAQIQEQITHGLSGPLTLITAPAGFGKTTLVVASITQLGMPAAWLSLDKEDNHSLRFLSYLIAAIKEVDSNIVSEAAQFLAEAQQTTPEMILTSLINDLDRASKEMVLVLDDYHLINSQAVHEEVAFLLDHCPRHFHLLISTRSDPSLPLARLRARGQIVELRAADLRFTETETVKFLNDVMGLQLNSASVAVLEERTEGWIAGLQMASLAVQGRLSMRGRQDLDRFIQEFAGTNRFIMDFMLEEVLAREPEEVQTFLLQTSILNRLSGPLCDAVIGSTSSQAMLEQLYRRNLFLVPLDEDGGGETVVASFTGARWYRYHHLFADLLQARLNQIGPQRVAQLYSRAAEWCERERQITEAVSYAFAAQNDTFAAGLIDKYWQPMANSGEIETVFSWLNALPADLLKNSPDLSTVYCMVLWLMGHVGAIEAHLEDAERALARSDETGEAGAATYSAELRMILAAMHSFVARYRDQHEMAITLAERALHLIPENLPPFNYEEMRSLAFLALGSAYDGIGDLKKAVDSYAEMIRGSRLTGNATGIAGITFRMVGALRQLGRLRDADTACQEALRFFETQRMSRLPAAGILHVTMSEVLVEKNDLETAEAHLVQGLELGKWSGRMNATKNAAYVLSRLKMARQDPDGALTALQEIEMGLDQPVSGLLRAELLAFRAGILIRQGAASHAAQCVEAAVRLTGQEQGQTRSIVNLAACRVFTALHPLAEASAYLSQALDAAETRGLIGVAMEVRLMRSLAFAQQGKTDNAEADLEHALTVAEPEGYARVFLDEGQPMQRLLALWLARAQPGPLRDYTIRLMAMFDAEIRPTPATLKTSSTTGSLLKPEARPTKITLVEPLSQRELEVLHLMALGCTNQAIARQLVVAPGTIKAHAASIYRKLDAANRTEAVARARQLGLVP